MIKNSPQPDKGKFKSIITIILILICVGLFLKFTDHLSFEAEVIAQKNVVTDIEYSLGMLLYDFVIKRKQDKLSKFDQENPFIPLSMYRKVPENYHGSVKNKAEISGSGWYFDLDTHSAIYRFSKKGVEDISIKVVWVIDDLNHNGVQDQNEVGYLKIEKGPNLNK